MLTFLWGEILVLTGSENAEPGCVDVVERPRSELREAKAAGICRAEYQRQGKYTRKSFRNSHKILSETSTKY